MLLAAAVAMILVAFALPLVVRASHIPAPEGESPTQHLEDRKAAIYENLRDLHGEFQMGKVSGEDYAAGKRELQTELAGVLDTIDRMNSHAGS